MTKNKQGILLAQFNIKLLFLLFVVLFFQHQLQAQLMPKKVNKEGRVGNYSLQVAQTMKDSLKLSAKQLDDIVAANKALDEEKMAVLKSQADRAVKQQKITAIEQKRDSLYKAILKPKQYEAYLKNKAVLLKF